MSNHILVISEDRSRLMEGEAAVRNAGFSSATLHMQGIFYRRNQNMDLEEYTLLNYIKKTVEDLNIKGIISDLFFNPMKNSNSDHKAASTYEAFAEMSIPTGLFIKIWGAENNIPVVICTEPDKYWSEGQKNLKPIIDELLMYEKSKNWGDCIEMLLPILKKQ